MSDFDPIENLKQHPAVVLGPWMCGGIGELLLTGALVDMAVDYWRRYAGTDPTLIKGAVIATVFLNILRTLQAIATLWHKFVDGFGEYVGAATSSPWYVVLDPLSTSAICLLSQVFFTVRLYRLTKGRIRLVFLVLVPTLLMGVGGYVGMVLMYVALVSTLASDVMITVSTSWQLYTSKTGYSRTNNLIIRLLHVTWITAALPSVCELLDLITFVTMSTKTSVFIAFHLMSPKLYSMSMLYTLNARQGLRSMNGSNSYSMNSRIERTDGIHVTTDAVHFTDPREPNPASVKFEHDSHNDSQDSVKAHAV